MNSILFNRLATLLCMLFLSAQISAQNTALIKGIMVDEKSEPLSFAIVRIEGTNTAMNTDLDGNFEFKNLAAGNYVVVASYLGYKPNKQLVKLAAGETKVIKIEMQPDNKNLKEVVVVGYGTQLRKEVTGAINKLGAKEITALPVPSVEAALQGKAAGVQVSIGSGLSGSASVVKIRGIASVSAGSDPLYVIDGIPISQDFFMRTATEGVGNGGGKNNNPLATINPEDIESIDILKDAAATAIYGSRGSNGVILITTKRAKKQGFKFDVSIREGISTMASRPQMLNNLEYLQLYQEAYENDGGVGEANLPKGITWADAKATNTNWVDQTTRIGLKQLYSIGTSYGGKKINVYVNATLDNSQSYVIGDAYRRASGRINLDYNISKNLKMSYSGSYSNGLNSRVDGGWGGGLGAAMSTALPIYKVKNDDGTYYTAGGVNNNPVLLRENKFQATVQQRTIHGLTLDYTPIKDLIVHMQGNYDYLDNTDDVYENKTLLDAYSNTNKNLGIAKRGLTYQNNFNVITTAAYSQKLKKNGKISYMLGNELQKFNTRSGYYQYNNVSGPLSKITPEDSNRDNSSSLGRVDLGLFNSQFGRINYSVNDKYFVQVNARLDYSSKFGSNYRYGFFPAIGAGWVISDENFMKQFTKVNYLKLRTSYGKSGNANIPDYKWLGLYGTNGTYNGQPIRYPLEQFNPDLHWESTYSFDIGIDYAIFNDRITGTLEFYNKNSSDVILKTTLPKYNGFPDYFANVAKINNKGIEFSVKALLVDRAKFSFSTDFNIARNYNKVLDIGPFTPEAVSGGTNDTRVVEGEPVGTNFLVRFSHVDPQNGKPVYLDINGNETYTWDPKDRVAVGNIYPKAVGGWNNTLKYKSFDLLVNFVYRIGGKIYDSSSKRQIGTFDGDNWNHTRDQFDRWQQPGDEATYPVLTRNKETYGSTTPWINTNLWLKDASYFRLRSLSLYYGIDQSFLKKVKFTSARVGIVATNVFILTKFRGLDPEVVRDFESPTDRNMSPNITYLTPPQERTLTLTLNLGF